MRLLLASRIDEEAHASLAANHDVVTAYGAAEDDLCRVVTDRDAIIFRSGVTLSRRVLEAARELRALIRAGSGLDNLDLDYTSGRGIVLERIPGPGAQAVAELTFGLLLAVARKIVVADGLWRQGHWVKSEMVGHQLQGKTLGIVGLGNIGMHVARLGLGWKMTVIGCVESPSPQREETYRAEGVELTSCDDVLERADFVSVHVPLTERTRGMVDAAAIARMKRGAFLANMARGGIVDEAALYADLRTGQHLAGAALDVHEREGEGEVSPFQALPNVVLTPHIGASTYDSQRLIGQEIVRIVDRLDASDGGRGASK